MNAGILSDAIFHDAEKARVWLEARLWKDGPICPKCGTVNEATLMKGKTTRPGLYQCNACREPFTVTVNTLYERSKIPLKNPPEQLAGCDASSHGFEKGHERATGRVHDRREQKDGLVSLPPHPGEREV